jgi:hypothetical protein
MRHVTTTRERGLTEGEVEAVALTSSRSIYFTNMASISMGFHLKPVVAIVYENRVNSSGAEMEVDWQSEGFGADWSRA